MTNRKIIIVPCILNNWLYCWPVCTTSNCGVSSSVRNSIASPPPMMKKKNDITMY